MKVLVEIFKKKFKVNIQAESLDAAKYKIMGSIKVTEIKNNSIVDFFNNEIFK